MSAYAVANLFLASTVLDN